jgi:hypothetical protein
MSIDMVLGLIFLTVTLSLITVLVYWSKKTIDKIANTDSQSLHKMQEEINDNGQYE